MLRFPHSVHLAPGLRYERYFGKPQAEKQRVATYLGYCKLEDEWQLAIKETTTTYEWIDEEEGREDVVEEDYTPLLKASRDIRLAAASRFDDLIASLVDHTKKQLEAIQKAENVARLKSAKEAGGIQPVTQAGIPPEDTGGNPPKGRSRRPHETKTECPE